MMIEKESKAAPRHSWESFMMNKCQLLWTEDWEMGSHVTIAVVNAVFWSFSGFPYRAKLVRSF